MDTVCSERQVGRTRSRAVLGPCAVMLTGKVRPGWENVKTGKREQSMGVRTNQGEVNKGFLHKGAKDH